MNSKIRVKFNEITRQFSVTGIRSFAIPEYISNNTYNKSKDLFNILKDSADRKELLKRGYDPSVKPTQRVVDGEVIDSTSKSGGNPYVREYLNEDAVRKTNNDRILNDYIDEKLGGSQGFDKLNIQNLDDNNPNTHFRVVTPSREYKYHGYNVDPSEKYSRDINGYDYGVYVNPTEESSGNITASVDFDVNGGFNIVNDPRNLKPLEHAITDEIAKTKPDYIGYSPSYVSQRLDGTESKNADRKLAQRDMLYRRKISQLFPESNFEGEGVVKMNDVDWRKFATKPK